MRHKVDIHWDKLDDFLKRCGSIHTPYKFAIAVLEDFDELVCFDQGVMLMLDSNRRIVRKHFKSIPRHWSTLYVEYYSRISNQEFALDADVSEVRNNPYVRIIDWENMFRNNSDFFTQYIRPRGLKSSLTFVLFDLKGAPATVFALDRTSDQPFTEVDIETAKTAVVHLNNLYKNMFVRPNDQVRIWDHKGNESLTQRESEVAELLCQGVTPANIARDLRISVGTANKHIGHIYKKIGVSSRQELLVKLLGK